MKVAATPDPPLARLQISTPNPTRIQRDIRSASHPKIGAVTMYETRNAVASEPIFASACGSPGKSWWLIFDSTAASTWRSM